ncbi:MAG: bifunctional diaminohydroxyphosphoribosylaminopyrimidine deaminase/5-amino-6-(5-phosphoribosylamino)uracil reductase RibD [Flavobacteriales bacterium]|nr:bifunctional diaminohydroxyphosphoribosylaminopyrimidine deaminase/5-amino-6-(5-phosphoribosylamino)uracil reductase RibD [Flavobacteriales bacterium]
MQEHEFFIRKCIDLARKGNGLVSPNPMVGSVIVYKGNIIGSGYHQKFGCNHAEVNAISSVKDKKLLKESTLYVNLEPCSHFGKTPPCADLIIKSRIPKVVVGSKDSFSLVCGKGIENMKKGGVKVILGVLEKECRELNKRFFISQEKKRPYVILKWAESSDGFIAPDFQPESFWMTSKESKLLVHKWRSQEDGIIIGRKTAELDNPRLTTRLVEGKNPVRIIIDSKLKLNIKLNIFNDDAKTIILNKQKEESVGSNNYIKIESNSSIIDILETLNKEDINSIIVEGGTTTIQHFINSNLWDEARIFITHHELCQGRKSPSIDKKNWNEKKIGTDSLITLQND